MRSATRELMNAHASAKLPPLYQRSKVSRGATHSSARIRFLRLSAVGLAAFALALSSVAASAADFSLPRVPIVSPGCGFFTLDVACSAATGPVSTSFGSFTANEQGDLAGVRITPDGRGLCMPLTGTATLDFGGGNSLALVSKATANDTLCITQPFDPADLQQLPTPAAPGPWPLNLTVTVDGLTSHGIYKNAAGNGSITGGWTTTADCFDVTTNQPLSICGLSGESVASFNLDNVSILNLLLDNGTGCPPSDPSCNPNPNPNPNPGATPELDSILLFGSGLSGLVAYAVRRRRAGMLFNSRTHIPPTQD